LVAGLNGVLAIRESWSEPEPARVVFEKPAPMPTPPPLPKPKPQTVKVRVVPVARPVVLRPHEPVHRLEPPRPHELAAHAPAAAPAPPAQAQPAVPVAAVPAPVVTAPPVQAVPTAAPPLPTAAPVSDAVDPGLIAAYDQKLTAAVQAAFRVPSTAADMGFKGRVRVEFTLHDGTVMSVRIDVPSGLGVVDRAALRAVQTANFPLPPQALAGKDGTYQIWVACT
jgi:TonB family protein